MNIAATLSLVAVFVASLVRGNGDLEKITNKVYFDLDIGGSQPAASPLGCSGIRFLRQSRISALSVREKKESERRESPFTTKDHLFTASSLTS